MPMTKRIPMAKKHGTVEALLRDGAYLHAFRSGGGLRVVRVSTSANLLAYGEYPDIGEALAHAEEDARAGGREYSEVYGKIHDHYLTGSSSPASSLDWWVLRGRAFDVLFEAGKFVFQSTFTSRRKTPQGVVAALRLDEIKRFRDGGLHEYADPKVRWKEDGYEFEASPFEFCNGELGHATKCVGRPKGIKAGCIDECMLSRTATFEGATLEECLSAADRAFSDREKWD